MEETSRSVRYMDMTDMERVSNASSLPLYAFRVDAYLLLERTSWTILPA